MEEKQSQPIKKIKGVAVSDFGVVYAYVVAVDHPNRMDRCN